MTRDQRLRRLEGLRLETDEHYVKSLSDEELAEHIEELRARLSETEYQDLVAKVRRQVRR